MLYDRLLLYAFALTTCSCTHVILEKQYGVNESPHQDLHIISIDTVYNDVGGVLKKVKYQARKRDVEKGEGR